LYVGFDVFTSLAGCVVAELCFVLAKARRRMPAVVISVVYLFLINAAAGIAASGGLEAVRASWLSFAPELYSASPVLFGLVIVWMLADHDHSAQPAQAWHVKASETAQNVKGLRDAWRDALGLNAPPQQAALPPATMGRDAPAGTVTQPEPANISNGNSEQNAAGGQGEPPASKS
jgi:hypothetical protein